MYIPSLLHGRAPNSPCPLADGSQIGSPLAFELLCGTEVNARQIATTQARSMNDCITQCTNHHGPRCDGVQFTATQQCIMLANVDDKNTAPNPTIDSAIAQLPDPGPVSDCNLLGSGSTQTNIGKKFQLACNSVWNGDDYEQQFHMSLESCMGACASNATGCGGISYETSQAFGFNNCYLKTKAPATANKLLKHVNTDTAIMMLQENDNLQPVTTVVSTVTMNMPESTQVALTTKVMMSTVPTPGVPISEAADPTEPAQPEAAKRNPTALTAGAVVGAVAFLALVSLAIWFIRRRRRSQAPASGSNAVRGNEKTWRSLDGEAENEGGLPPVVRTETVVTVSSRDEGLRDSQNGLKQHQCPRLSANSRAGIPPEFDGPAPDGISR